MPTKKTSSTPKKTIKKTSPVDEINNNNVSIAEKTTSLNQISQQLNLILILGVALFLFNLFLFWKIKQIEKKGVTAGTQGAQQAADNHLSDESLKKYAKELKLDQKKFDQCYDSSAKKDVVAKEAAEATALGIQGTPGFFVNGRFLGGAFPYEFFKEIIDKELAGTATDTCSDYSQQLQQYCKDEANAAFKPAPQNVEIGTSPVIGKADARVTIIEYSDFECPFCIRAYPTVQQIMKEYPNDVKIVYKNLPLTNIHPRAQKSAEAAQCAKDQGKFWEYHDKMFEAGK